MPDDKVSGLHDEPYTLLWLSWQLIWSHHKLQGIVSLFVEWVVGQWEKHCTQLHCWSKISSMRMHEEEHESLARQISPPLLILLIGHVLDAQSKNICHISSREVIWASITSSRMSMCSFEVFETESASRKSARAWPLIAFWSHIILRQQNSPIC